MSVSLRYGSAAALLIVVVSLGLWPFLDGNARSGVLAAGAIALPVQAVAFWMLVHFRERANGFVLAWAGGMALRTVALGVAALVVIRSGAANAVPFLLALAGFFFGLLLLEPLYFRAQVRRTA